MKSRSNTFAEQWRRKAEEQWRRSNESDLELKFNRGFELNLKVFWVVLGGFRGFLVLKETQKFGD
jgi:hypothetical protein